MRNPRVRIIAEIGIAVALGAVLGLVKVYKLPQGGSITAASMVPIFYVALRWGIGPGVLAGVLLGLVNYLIEPVFLHPLQFLLDYPVAFGALGLAGLLTHRPALGVVVGGAGRLASHFLSGVVFFAQYAPEGMNPMVYSAIYNGSYMLPEIVISVFVTLLLLRSLPRPQPQA
ncbi:MAG: energy-coupled thiamine transporter ThiT [Armatimonadota bacterium]|nr:energy-coupled thiamine transporter ThiT [Armatimonadota bacterium]MDR5697454.1 energy-coupled thiamine transporter ThiT [Armatimonadota bacterium]